MSDEVERALADPRRIVWLDGVHNFRDLGGYPAAHGVTKWQTVYRADGLGRLSPADIAILRARGLRSVIDLRTETELSERGRYPVDQHDVTFHHLPVLDKTWAAEDLPDVRTEGDFLMWAYRDMLRVGGDKLGQAMRVIATAGSTPLVFHCAAGKDRTGLLAALTLALIGVSDEFIAADYGKTAEGMQRMRAWAIAQSAEAAERMNEVPAHFYASPPAVMLALLAELRGQHGSISAFAATLGVDADVIAGLHATLVEPSE